MTTTHNTDADGNAARTDTQIRVVGVPTTILRGAHRIWPGAAALADR
ncbi:MAG: hypothetical protein ACRDRL_15045 [Sciscionella sp.]